MASRIRNGAGAAAFLALLLDGGAAQADVATAEFDFADNGVTAGFDAFDPTLGTLNKVHIEISGSADVTVTTAQQLGPGDTPIPFPISVAMGATFTSVASGGHGFTTSFSNSVFGGNGLADGAGNPTDVEIDFDFSFTFTPTTDLVGFAVATDGDMENGTLAGFLPPLGNTQIMELDEFNAVYDGSVLQIVASGSGNIEYDYTPPLPPPQGVPEPATLALLGTGLAATLRLRRKRNQG